MAERPPHSDMPPTLTPAQWNVMRAVWHTEPTTVRRVLAALAEEDQRDYRTIQTFLYQLVEKGYVDFHLEGRTALFRSTVDKATGFRVHLRRYFGAEKDREDLELLQRLVEEELGGKRSAPRTPAKRPRPPRRPEEAPRQERPTTPAAPGSPLFPWED